MQRDDASERQLQAANPRLSTWLSANAGSGKTRVLTDRVARMLLSGVDPSRILCLTYTKAAASEMQNRLFKRLGEWAMKEDAKLRLSLDDLGVEGAIDAGRLGRARQLFARAIETPGGLRIQTIHSFCASLLRRFPLEAGVSPQFTEMDDRASTLLRDEILDEMADGLAPGPISKLARAYTGEDFAALADEVIRHRNDFGQRLSPSECRALFDVSEEVDEESILSQVFLGGEAELLGEVISVLETGSIKDEKAAEKLRSIDIGNGSHSALAILEGVFLTGKGAGQPFSAKIGSFPTKPTQAKLGPLLDPLESLMRRVEAGREARVALVAAHRTATLHEFAAAFLPEFAARKARRGLLDFDDLITRAKALLTDQRVAQWVLYRLDGGIDHILVDEAQDTSPDQWRVIELLADEITSGTNTSGRPRTLFVVGDKKQSIYSFQGADVAAFDAKRDLFDGKLEVSPTPLQQMLLEHSFRSSPAILRLVDMTFDERRGKGLGGEVKHIAFNAGMPGRVDLWPAIEKSDVPDIKDWFDPVDLISDDHHATKLGQKVAARIKDMIDTGTQIPIDGGKGFRPVHAGDFLILVRRRSEIFGAIIQACKKLNLPIAGADRLKLGAELAVRDLAALLAFLATPEDDLSLAACLRSPLFGWTEHQLFELAQPRTGYLWEALRNSAKHSDTLAVLNDLLGQSDFLRPYDLVERMLTRHDGRRKLLARLGGEAEDGIDELLSQALAYERNEVPSLTGFLGWLETDDVEVKRQMDSAGNKIRVMTVHGAKGLEAPIVILPDTARPIRRERDEVFVLDEFPVWKTSADESPVQITEARALRKAKEEAEAMRLLYVAMTRAQSWLIVAATGDLGSDKASDDDGAGVVWYKLIRNAMVALNAVPQPDGELCLVEGDWPPPKSDQVSARADDPLLPDWASSVAPDAPRPPQPLSPSKLGGAKALAGDIYADEGSKDAMDRGTRLHRLLEMLPNHEDTDWPAVAKTLLAGSSDTEMLLAEATAVLTNPELAHVFGPGTLAEVPVSAVLFGNSMMGTIDRLIFKQGQVTAVDFKSNLLVPETAQDVPEGLLRQLGAYDEALRQIYPNHEVCVAILWTATAQLMPLDPDIVRSALGRATLT